MGRLSSLGLPLLTMELLQKSARRRTWVVRVLFVLAMLWFLLTECSRFWGADLLATLGSGGPLFAEMMGFLFCGVYLIVPLSSFALITSEKERDSLQLLLLTRLGPWTIVLEKLLSQLVPAWLFLSTSLPILAVAYSLDGVSESMLASGIWTLSLTALHCGCVALMCSAWSKTSVQAFILTLVIGFAMTLGPPFYVSITGLGGRAGMEAAFSLCGPFLFFVHGQAGIAACLVASIPLVTASLTCLLLARVFLTRRAVVMQGYTARVKARLLNWAPIRIVKRSPIGKLTLSRSLPKFASVAWRETRQVVRFWRLVMPLVAISLFLVVGTAIKATAQEATGFLAFCHTLLWLIAELTICAKAAGLITIERTRLTLDVLLTTPITGRELVRQKMRSIYILSAFFLVLFIGVAVLESLSKLNDWGVSTWSRGRGQPVPLAFLAAVITPAVYLPMCGWLSLTIGLYVKTTTRATIGSVLAVAGWCCMPVLMCCMPFANSLSPDEDIFIFLGPPLTPLFFAFLSVSSFFEDEPLEGWFTFTLIWNTVLYGGFLIVIRTLCLKRADAVLGAGKL